MMARRAVLMRGAVVATVIEFGRARGRDSVYITETPCIMKAQREVLRLPVLPPPEEKTTQHKHARRRGRYSE